jgi:hypothetical protein
MLLGALELIIGKKLPVLSMLSMLLLFLSFLPLLLVMLSLALLRLLLSVPLSLGCPCPLLQSQKMVVPHWVSISNHWEWNY